jgi:hypothetical protein
MLWARITPLTTFFQLCNYLIDRLHASAKIKIALLAIGPAVAREVHAIDVVYPTWDSLAPEYAKILASQQRPWMHSTASPVGLDEGISMKFLLCRLPFHKRPIMEPLLHLPAFFVFAQPTLIYAR